MQGKARSELPERWDLEALAVLDFEQMLFSEQTREDCHGSVRRLNSEPNTVGLGLAAIFGRLARIFRS
jgi:hypothetical protein